jgi:DNA-binding LytR/AlgR family response regulator
MEEASPTGRRSAPAWRIGVSERIASRLGERILLLEVARITHCFARDKLIYAAVDDKHYVVDHTVAELEAKLDPRQFVWVREIDAWFGGKLLVRFRDANATELQASRDQAAEIEAAYRRLTSFRRYLGQYWYVAKLSSL